MLAQRARRLLPVLLAALVLALAACTGGADDPPSPPATTPIAATATTTPTAPPAPIEPPTTPTPSPTSTATPTPTATVMPSPTATPAPTSTATPTPTPSEPPTTFRYDTYDTTGAVTTHGSYAFLEDPADTASAVSTYEALRDGTTTALRIHETDADGVSRAAFLDTVEVGDLFEWRQAEDCWVRYQIELTPIAGTGATRDFGIRWVTYAPTGCSGAVPATSASTMEWRPPDAIQSPTLTSPVRHGQYLLIPTAWDGPMAPGEKGDDPLRLTGILVEPQVDVAPPPHYRASIDAMSPTERVLVETSDPAEARRLIPLWRDPVLPEGWTLRRAEVGTPDAPFYGYMAQYVDERGYPALLLYVSYPDRRPDYRWVTSASNSVSTYEVRTVDGHAALVRYSPPGPLHNRYKATKVQIFDETTGIKYWLLGQHQSLSGANVDATIEIARSLFESPNPLPSPTTFRYDTYDTTGAVAEPGSYAFLADPADTASAVTTYEGLRDGTATALRIHETDADGVSRAAFLDTVEVGDLFEWREAEDCFVRYKVTAVKPDPAGTVPRKSLGVESIAYAFTGCSGAIATGSASGSAANSASSSTASVTWGALPNLGGTSLTVPIVQGPFQLVPAGWTGATKPVGPRFPAGPTIPFAETTSLAEARTLPHWREPELPEGWTFTYAWSGDEVEVGYFEAFYNGLTLTVSASGINAKYSPKAASATYTNDGSQTSVRETRQIAGRPARVHRSITAEQFPTTVHVWDEATGVLYTLHWSGHATKLIALAQSMFE